MDVFDYVTINQAVNNTQVDWVPVMDEFVGNNVQYEVVHMDHDRNLCRLEPVDKRRKSNPYWWHTSMLTVVGRNQNPDYKIGDFVEVNMDIPDGHVYQVIGCTPYEVVIRLVYFPGERHEGRPVKLIYRSRIKLVKYPETYQKIVDKGELKVNDVVEFHASSTSGPTVGIVTGFEAIRAGSYRSTEERNYSARVQIVHVSNPSSGHYLGEFKTLPLFNVKVLARGVQARRTESERREVLASLRSQSTFNAPTPRFLTDDFEEYRLKKDACEFVGKTARKLVTTGRFNDESLTKLNRALEVLRGSLHRTPHNIKSVFIEFASEHQCHLYECDDCGNVEFRDELARSTGGDICRDCRDRNYVWSETMDTYIPSVSIYALYLEVDDYEAETPSDRITLEYGRAYGFVYNDGAFYGEELADYLNFEDENISSGDRASRDGLRPYHSSYDRSFQYLGDASVHPHIGVELEVYANPRKQAVHALRKHYDTSWMFLETDGSLHDRYGFEVVTQPMTKELWAEHGPKICTTLQEAGAVGYNIPDDTKYGIHINVARDKLTGLQEGRILMFLHSEENINFVTAIGQRAQIYRADRSVGDLGEAYQQIRRVGGLKSVAVMNKNNQRVLRKKPGTLGKYCPLYVKNNILEFRFFQSTLHTPSFMKNLEFIWALIEWTSIGASTGTSWSHRDFVAWLNGKPNVEKEYPNLMAYLRRPKFVVKYGKGAIQNTWIGLMRPAVQTSVVIPERDDSPELLAA